MGTISALSAGRVATPGGAIYATLSSSRPPRTWSRGPQSPYGMHKLVGELYLEFYRREHGLRYTVLRYGNVYGPRQDPHGEAGVVAIFTYRLLRGKAADHIRVSRPAQRDEP